MQRLYNDHAANHHHWYIITRYTSSLRIMGKYHDKYRVPSARLRNWDYRRHAAYFITICTQNRERYFGDIAVSGMSHGTTGVGTTHDVETLHATSLQQTPPSPPSPPRIHLSPVGVIADILWHEIKNHATDVELGAFIVMPNHIHGILILTGDNTHDGDDVQTLHATSLHSAISPKSGSVSAIIRSYKSAVSRHAHRLGYHFEWQSRFYDHIIRDDASFRKISDYIIHNPAKWNEDKFYNETDNIKQ